MMKMNRINGLIAASALAIVALLGFQISWMRHSRKLLEEQFKNRVTMALCSTVEVLANDKICSEEIKSCCRKGDDKACADEIKTWVRNPASDSVLRAALRAYQVDLPYKVLITKKENAPTSSGQEHYCSLEPVLQGGDQLLKLEFQGKNDYFLRHLGLMVAASAAILALICLIFGLGVYYLLRQKRMSERNRDFFNLMTHEFRTPLTNIRLASNLLTRKNAQLAGDPYVEIIQKESGQLTEQVEKVLHLAGLEKGDYALRKETVDLKNLADDVVAGMTLQIRDRGARVQVDSENAPCIIEGDVFHLGNAFRNLLDNALKYSKSQPTVNIRLWAEGDGCCIRFSDNGVGLAPQEQEAVFKKFYRGDHGGLQNEKGFGLGLAYVAKIVEMHRGSIRACSENGRGCRFDLFFPNQKPRLV
jgi:two-component system, OmpR family, phosphate regulon sensor histidine kinase PhoR